MYPCGQFIVTIYEHTQFITLSAHSPSTNHTDLLLPYVASKLYQNKHQTTPYVLTYYATKTQPPALSQPVPALFQPGEFNNTMQQPAPHFHFGEWPSGLPLSGSRCSLGHLPAHSVPAETLCDIGDCLESTVTGDAADTSPERRHTARSYSDTGSGSESDTVLPASVR